MSGVGLVKSVVLVGLMGSGKTSVGRRLAAMLGADFADCDDEIVAAAGMSIPDIFAAFGEEHFRMGETKVLRRLLEGPPAVIATGGGAFVNDVNRSLIASRGVSVWLSASVEVLWGRVKGKSGRPLLEVADPLARLTQLAKDREPAYRQADVEVSSVDGEVHENVARRIIDALRDFETRSAQQIISGKDD